MRYADFYGNNELRQAAFSYASLLGGRFISKDWCIWMRPAAPTSRPPQITVRSRCSGKSARQRRGHILWMC